MPLPMVERTLRRVPAVMRRADSLRAQSRLARERAAPFNSTRPVRAVT